MKGNELVWRTVIDRALGGSREWLNVDDIAHAAGTPPSTAHLALTKLITIGAVERRLRGGIIVVNPEKALMVLASWRNLAKDTLARTTVSGISPLLDTSLGPYALGGADAAQQHLTSLGAQGNVAGTGMRVVYITANRDISSLPPGNEVLVLGMDSRAQIDWSTGYTSWAQTYADLFAQPGWQAEEYRSALHRALFAHNIEVAR